MPQRSGNRGFPTMLDLVKREDEVRRATNRAEVRMQNRISKAGGIESARKHNIAVRNWEQEQVRQELHNIQTASKRSHLLRLQDPEALRLADPELAEAMEEQQYYATQNNITDEDEYKGYGRNFFGYTSQPGSNKPHYLQMKALQGKYSNVRNYYEYAGPKQMDKAARERLQKQKLLNEDVQEKVKSFSKPEKPKVPGYQAPDNSSETTETNANETDANIVPTDKQKESVSIKVSVESHANPQSTAQDTTQSYMSMMEAKNDQTNKTIGNVDVQSPSSINKEQISRRTSKILVSPPSSGRNWEDGSIATGSTISMPLYRAAKPRTTMDIVFDADTYAPDGRLRTKHTLPDFDKSFKEARQARYIRSKERREVERELSVNEMFGR